MSRLPSRRWVLFVAIVLAGGGWQEAVGRIIPPERRIEWRPGIPGGIPEYPVGVNVRDVAYGARGDGVADDTAAIQAAVKACPDGQAVYLPAGTYRLTAQLDVFDQAVVLRGDGPDRTFLRCESTTGNIVRIFSWSSQTGAAVTGGFEKGSTVLTVDNAAPFAVGDFVFIDEENDPAVTDAMQGYQKRAVCQTVEVTAIEGNRLTIARPLYVDYNPAMNVRLTQHSGVRGAGIEDLCLERTVGEGYDNINITLGVCCWVRNVESANCRASHLRLHRSFGCEVRECYFHGAHHLGGGSGYGAFCFDRSTDNLIVDNVFEHVRHAMVLEYGGCGNVYAYNYSREPLHERGMVTDWLMSDAALHGGHPYMNLYEGNVCAHIDMDNYLGSSRFNTFFRNHVERVSVPAAKWGLVAVEVQANNLFENVVGNVLCLPGATGEVWRIGRDRLTPTIDPRVEETLLRHGNFDYVTGQTQWAPAIADRELPASLYLKEKPAFFGDLPWPAIGPDLDPMVGKLPARVRWEAMQAERAARPAGGPTPVERQSN